MVGERRYRKKRGSKKKFKRWGSKKGESEKVANLTPALPKPEFNASGSSLYSWIHVPPVTPSQTFDDNKINRGKFTHSLKLKCAEVVGANADALSSSYLEDAPWSCWRNVWSSVLKKGTDSPELFRMFARQFGDQSSFPCHSMVSANTSRVYSSLQDLREKALNACLIPVHRKHRVENIFSNVFMKDFVAFVDGLTMASVVIDASAMPLYSTSEFLSLCNLTNLRALDLSKNPQVDDRFLYTIKSRITSRASNLQVLNISGCPHVTSAGLSSFLEGSEGSSLSYVESDQRLSPQVGFEGLYSGLHTTNCKDVVAGTKWRLVHGDDKLAIASKYKLGLKFHFLQRQMSTIESPKILWDFKFFPLAMNVSDENVEDLHFTVWNERLSGAMKKPSDLPFVYVKDAEINVASPRLPKETLPVKRAKYVEATKSRPKKPKVLSTSAKAFFYGV